jgi:hypothetical protein
MAARKRPYAPQQQPPVNVDMAVTLAQFAQTMQSMQQQLNGVQQQLASLPPLGNPMAAPPPVYAQVRDWPGTERAPQRCSPSCCIASTFDWLVTWGCRVIVFAVVAGAVVILFWVFGRRLL